MKRVRRLLVQPEGPRAALTPVFSAVILTVTAAVALSAWQSTPRLRPPAPPVPPAPSVPVRLLAQVQQAPAPAPAVTPYTKWVSEDVAYIISNDERTAFKNLPSDPEREHFIEQFWLRRDPTPGTPENEMKEEHYRRIAYANRNFAAGIPGWKTDRGRIYILYGPPDQKESHPSGSATSTVPSEKWLYQFIEGVGTNVVIEFVDPTKSGEYRMTTDPKPIAMLRASGDRPVTSAGTPKAGATVQSTGPGAVSISVPLAAYGDHRITVYGLVTSKEPPQGEGHLQGFEQLIQGPAPLFTKIIALPKGSYQIEIVVKDIATGKLAADSVKFDVQ